MTETSDRLVSTSERGPGQTLEKRHGPADQEGKEESSHFRHAQWDHHRTVSPRVRLNASSVLEGEWGWEECSCFFSSGASESGTLCLAVGAQHGEKGVREHTERDVTVPSLPRADFILIESYLSFGFLDALFDGPATSDGLHHVGQGRARAGKHQHVGHLRGVSSRGEAAPDNQPVLPACPGRLGFDEFDTRPVKEARPFAPIARTQRLPCFGG